MGLHFSLLHPSDWKKVSQIPRMVSLLLISTTVFLLAQSVTAAITVDFNCTANEGGKFVYTTGATVCSNSLSDTACDSMYPPVEKTDPKIAAGAETARPLKCYTTSTADPFPLDNDMKTAAIANCPKTCGYCCQTSEYNCPNVRFPRLNCATITSAQCNSVDWRPIIAVDCPSACGFCNDGGCVDAVVSCANDISVCNNYQLQDFVNKNCQKTCGRCSASPVNPSNPVNPCTSYAKDSSTNCANWARNGFCTNDFYTPATRKLYCATTCKVC